MCVPGVNFKVVRKAVLIEDMVELAGIDTQAVLIADIHGDGAILLQVPDVLVDKSQRRIGRIFSLYVGHRNPVPGRQIEI